jgi:Universal stress protein family
MIASAAPTPRLQEQLATARSGTDGVGSRPIEPDVAPIVVAVDDTRTARAAAGAAVRLARDLAAPLVFVYVRRALVDAREALLPAPPRPRDARGPARPE